MGIAGRRGQGRATAGSAPLPLRMRSTLEPVTEPTWAMPCESRRITPICEGVSPLRASLQQCSSTWSPSRCRPHASAQHARHTRPAAPAAPCGEIHLVPTRHRTVPSQARLKRASQAHFRVEVFELGAHREQRTHTRDGSIRVLPNNCALHAEARGHRRCPDFFADPRSRAVRPAAMRARSQRQRIGSPAHLSGGDLQPAGRRALVGQRRGRHALSGGVHATHGD
jgi:hypothetical protein